MFENGETLVSAAIQPTAAIVTDRGAMLSFFDRLAAGIHCQGFSMSRRDTGHLLIQVDEYIDDIVVVFIIRDQDHFYDAVIIAAVIDADTDGGIAFFIDLCQQQPDGIGVKGFCVTELH